MWSDYLTPRSVEEALDLRTRYGDRARIIAGGTDVMVEVQRRHSSPDALIDITRLPGLGNIRLDSDGWIHMGALVTHNDVVASDLCRQRAFALTQACAEVGAPQIRNRGTVIGNVASASPANDTIPALSALGARVVTMNPNGGRRVPIDEFIVGPGRTVLEPDEIIVAATFPQLEDDQRSTFLKLGLRRAQAIAVTNVAVVLRWQDDLLTDARIALGSVAPTIVRASRTESALLGRPLTDETIRSATANLSDEVRPIDDIRGSADYRRYMAAILVRQALQRLASGAERAAVDGRPVKLWSDGHSGLSGVGVDGPRMHSRQGDEPIAVTINGEPVAVTGANDRTLSQVLRDIVGLSGTKEACWEGECGACTVLINGSAVVSCLVPGPQVHGHDITTVEGLGYPDGALHPVQQAFIDAGALQCGFCTPGFLVSGAALMNEVPAPTTADIKQAISGNLCRCTTYYPIVTALEHATREVPE